MKTKFITTIALLGLVAACSSDSNDSKDPTPTPTNTPVVGPCEGAAAITGTQCNTGTNKTPVIGDVTLTSTSYLYGGKVRMYDVIDSDGYEVKATGSVANAVASDGSKTEIIYGQNPFGGEAILSINSDSELSEHDKTANLAFDGYFAQVTYGDNERVGTKTDGTVSMNVDANAGTMTLSGSEGFAPDGSVLAVEDLGAGSQYVLDENGNKVNAAIFGGTETVGYYAGQFEGDNNVTGTFSGELR